MDKNQKIILLSLYNLYVPYKEIREDIPINTIIVNYPSHVILWAKTHF